MGHNVEASARLVGDIKLTVSELTKKIKGKQHYQEWHNKLQTISKKNKDINDKLMADTVVPMTYYSSYSVLKQFIPADTILVGEGANTMDIGRTIFEH